MKKLLFLAVFLHLSACVPGYRTGYGGNSVEDYVDKDTRYLKKRFSPGKSRYERVMHVLKKYSPDGFYIVGRELVGSSRFGISVVRSILSFSVQGMKPYLYNTIVHEANHAYCSQFLPAMIDLGKIPSVYNIFAYQSLYIGNGWTIFVKKTRTFPSRMITSVFPEYLEKDRKLISRYKGYVIKTKKDQSTQIYGIYGLLDEFNSYYHGTKVMYDLLPFYQTRKDIPTAIRSYLQGYYGTNYAYAEFKLFILLYLILAEKQYPAIFNGIVNNSNFIRAFLAIERNYRMLLVNFNKRKETLRKWLIPHGYRLMEINDSIYLDPVRKGLTFTRHGAGTFEAMLKVYLQEMEKPEYVRMMKLLKDRLGKEKK